MIKGKILNWIDFFFFFSKTLINLF
jgi:hypothetical protein